MWVLQRAFSYMPSTDTKLLRVGVSRLCSRPEGYQSVRVFILQVNFICSPSLKLPLSLRPKQLQFLLLHCRSVINAAIHHQKYVFLPTAETSFLLVLPVVYNVMWQTYISQIFKYCIYLIALYLIALVMSLHTILQLCFPELHLTLPSQICFSTPTPFWVYTSKCFVLI